MPEPTDIFRTAIESSADGFWVVDRQGRLLAVNKAYELMSGYSREELLTMRVQDLEAKESPEETAAHIEALMREGKALFDTLHRRKDGTVWHAEISISVSMEEGGRLFVFIRDIVRRKRSEALLLTRQRFVELAERGQFDQLMQAALDEAELYTGSAMGFFHFVAADQEHLLLQAWSSHTLKTMCQTDGKGLHYPISKAGVWVDCFYQKEPVIHNDYESLSHRKGMPVGHAPVIRELVVPVIRSDKVLAIFGVGNKTTDYTREDVELVQTISSLVIDLVESNRLDEALHWSEKQLRLITDSVPALISYVDENFRLRHGNQKFMDRFQLPFERIEGASIRDLLGEAAWEVAQPYMQRALAGERVSYEAELPYRDISPCWIQATYTPDRDADGQVKGFISHVLDISRLKRLEERSIHSAQTCAVGELALGMGHEINNPLTGIINCAQILVDRQAVTPDNDRFLEQIIKDGKRVAEVVRRLMFFSRAGGDKRELVSMRKLVEDVLLLSQRRFEKERIIVKVTAPDLPLHVAVNPQQLEQVIHQLLGNARYALLERWQHDSRPMCLRIAMHRVDNDTGGVCRLTIHDNGTGIPGKWLEKVGRMFFTTKPAGVGAGLGLSISRQIVEQHGGGLGIASVEGEFTEITVELPLGDRQTDGAD